MGNTRARLLEVLVLLVAGLVFALLANRLSPRGLSLSREYFARAEIASATPKPVESQSQNKAAAPETNAVAERLASKGLSVLDTKQAEALFRDPQYDQELIVFVDARSDQHYQDSHIPGAYQFDRYYPERYFPTVLPACLNAAKIVVYCTGGKCEDSEFAALALVEAGIPADKISVFVGGMNDWTAAKLPLETGARKSGVLKTQ
jgi:rhodanese-related sulfurtransferase